jgi:hypothetical protein
MGAMLKQTELSLTILKLQTECSKKKMTEGLTFMRLVLVPFEERVVLDRLVVSEEGVRQLALDV